MRTFCLALVALVVMCLPASAQRWEVKALPVADTVISAVVDTAHSEPSFCLGVDVDTAAHLVTIWQAQPATVLRQTRGGTQFSCVPGAAVAHGHFLSAGHVDGPSDQDLMDVRGRSLVAIVVVIDRFKQRHFQLYSLPNVALHPELR